MKINVHVIISGCVQGVWYRASTKQKAEQLGITGWVKNTIEGGVEAVFEGEKKNIEKAIKFCSRGPPKSKVSSCDVEWDKPVGGYQGFVIKETL